MFDIKLICRAFVVLLLGGGLMLLLGGSLTALLGVAFLASIIAFVLFICEQFRIARFNKEYHHMYDVTMRAVSNLDELYKARVRESTRKIDWKHEGF